MASDSIKLLIADDEQEFAVTLVTRLKLRNYDVRMATSGQGALDAIKEELPDVLLLDLKMPDLDGLEVLSILREEHPELKVIILTGHGSIEAGRSGMELGALDYLMKPVDLDQLIQTVQNVCNKS